MLPVTTHGFGFQGAQFCSRPIGVGRGRKYERDEIGKNDPEAAIR